MATSSGNGKCGKKKQLIPSPLCPHSLPKACVHGMRPPAGAQHQTSSFWDQNQPHSTGPQLLLPVRWAVSPGAAWPAIGTFLALSLCLEPGRGPACRHCGKALGAPSLCPHSPIGSVSCQQLMQGHPEWNSSRIPFPISLRGEASARGNPSVKPSGLGGTASRSWLALAVPGPMTLLDASISEGGQQSPTS